jgi:hypothetical protein
MSELGKVPNFEPDEEFKKMLEDLFEPKKKKDVVTDNKEKSDQEFINEAKERGKKKPTRKVRIPEPPAQTKEEEKKAVQFAQKELDILFVAFYEFTEVAGETIVFGYLHSDIQELVARFEDMDIILKDKIDKEKLTEYGLTDFEKYRKIRARILHDIYDKYGKSKEKE